MDIRNLVKEIVHSVSDGNGRCLSNLFFQLKDVLSEQDRIKLEIGLKNWNIKYSQLNEEFSIFYLNINGRKENLPHIKIQANKKLEEKKNEIPVSFIPF